MDVDTNKLKFAHAVIRPLGFHGYSAVDCSFRLVLVVEAWESCPALRLAYEIEYCWEEG